MEHKEENLKDRIYDFLRDPSMRECTITGSRDSYHLHKFRYDEEADILYMLETYDSPIPHIDESMKYAGIFSYRLERLIDIEYRLRRTLGISYETVNREEEVNTFIQECKNEAVRRIGDGPVEATERSEECRYNDHKYFEEYGADQEAKRLFYAREAQGQLSIGIEMNASTSSLVRIHHDHDAYLDEIVTDHIAKKANVINERLWQIGIVKERLADFEKNAGDHHTIRAIAENIEPSMKTVTLHLQKDGIEFSGKYEAFRLRYVDDFQYYWAYGLDAQSQKAFDCTFGRNADILPSDIRQITYGKKVIYSAV